MFVFCIAFKVRTKLTNHVPVGMNVLYTEVLDVAGESFVQPQIIPPLHRH